MHQIVRIKVVSRGIVIDRLSTIIKAVVLIDVALVSRNLLVA